MSVIGIQLAAGQRAVLLLELAGGEQLVVGLDGVLLRVELLGAVVAAEINLATLIGDGGFFLGLATGNGALGSELLTLLFFLGVLFVTVGNNSNQCYEHAANYGFLQHSSIPSV